MTPRDVLGELSEQEIRYFLREEGEMPTEESEAIRDSALRKMRVALESQPRDHEIEQAITDLRQYAEYLDGGSDDLNDKTCEESAASIRLLLAAFNGMTSQRDCWQAASENWKARAEAAVADSVPDQDTRSAPSGLEEAARRLLDAVEGINLAFSRVAVPDLYTQPMRKEIRELREARDALRTALGEQGGETRVKGCLSCGEEMVRGECPSSKRACGHHCDCSWTQDKCCWCGRQWGESLTQDGDPLTEPEEGKPLAEARVKGEGTLIPEQQQDWDGERFYAAPSSEPDRRWLCDQGRYEPWRIGLMDKGEAQWIAKALSALEQGGGERGEGWKQKLIGVSGAGAIYELRKRVEALEARLSLPEDQTEGACSCTFENLSYRPDPACPVHGSCPNPNCVDGIVTVTDAAESEQNPHGRPRTLRIPCPDSYHTPSDQQTEEAPSDGSCPVDHATLTGRRGAGSVCPECGFDALAPSDQQGAG